MSEQQRTVSSTPESSHAQDIVRGIKFPPQPSILVALTKELQQTEPSFNTVLALLKKDIAISAKLLKLINSPLYCSGKKIDSIERALARLGLFNLHSIVLNSCLKETFIDNDASSEKLWEHTQVVAETAKNIAHISKATCCEHAYMTGLFHDAALPLIKQKDEYFQQVIDMDTLRGGDIRHFETHNTLTKTHHAVIGNLLARSWGLPNDVCEAILLHHDNDFELFSNGNSRALGMILVLADIISRQCCEEHEAEEHQEHTHVFEQIILELNLDEHDLEELYSQATEIAQMASL